MGKFLHREFQNENLSAQIEITETPTDASLLSSEDGKSLSKD
ncbi:35548_t:CDS:2 [Racocetra persica]|uniref:35548_t:CDS:1 n=1 Tax=Racocetra persica TaxID=160502 RepID=A0ACA9LX42_9GLOM|nr:35548_t:CDS:2 [Racocetra persica]